MKKYLPLLWVVCTALLQTVDVSAQPYNLKRCLEEGLEQNYSIRIVKNEQQISDNNTTLANAGKLPEVSLSAGYSGEMPAMRDQLRAGGTSSSASNYGHTLNAGLDVSWTLFDGFRIQTNLQRLEELKRQGAVSTRLTIEDFIASLAAEYYNYVQQQIRLKNFLYAVSLSRERLRIVEARYRIGSFSRLDLQQAQVDFNADSSKFINQHQLVMASLIHLNELMARRPVETPLQEQDTLIVVNERLNLALLEEQMLRNNALLLRAEGDTHLAELNLKTLQSRNYPSLKLGAGYGYRHNHYGTGTSRQRHTWGPNFGATLGVTLFDGNRRREQRNARIQIDNAQLQREQLELTLRANLADFWQSYRNNINLLRLEEQNLTAARENHEIAMERYILGDLSGIEMREAQKSLLDAEERILTAQYNTKLCEISLLQLIGNVTDYLR